jgi:hypothetical protein
VSSGFFAASPVGRFVSFKLREMIMNIGECDGTPCPLFVDGYCTDLKPKEAGCVGKESCRRFEHINFDLRDEIQEENNYLFDEN